MAARECTSTNNVPPTNSNNNRSAIPTCVLTGPRGHDAGDVWTSVQHRPGVNLTGAAPGDLERGPPDQPNLEQLWGVVTAIQQQVTQSQLQLATLLAALSAPTGAPPGAQSVPVQPVTAAPFGGRWQPRNLHSDFQREAAEEDLRDIDKKDVAPPSKYRGDASVWRHWYTKLHTFMIRRDPRWGELLEAVRRRSKDP